MISRQLHHLRMVEVEVLGENIGRQVDQLGYEFELMGEELRRLDAEFAVTRCPCRRGLLPPNDPDAAPQLWMDEGWNQASSTGPIDPDRNQSSAAPRTEAVINPQSNVQVTPHTGTSIAPAVPPDHQPVEPPPREAAPIYGRPLNSDEPASDHPGTPHPTASRARDCSNAIVRCISCMPHSYSSSEDEAPIELARMPGQTPAEHPGHGGPLSKQPNENPENPDKASTEAIRVSSSYGVGNHQTGQE